jgi:hypothetical protein
MRWIFSILLVPPDVLWPWGSTQLLIEMSTRNCPGGNKRPVRRLTTLQPSVSRMSENVGASTSRIPNGLNSLYRDNFTILSVAI